MVTLKDIRSVATAPLGTEKPRLSPGLLIDQITCMKLRIFVAIAEGEIGHLKSRLHAQIDQAHPPEDKIREHPRQ